MTRTISIATSRRTSMQMSQSPSKGPTTGGRSRLNASSIPKISATLVLPQPFTWMTMKTHSSKRKIMEAIMMGKATNLSRGVMSRKYTSREARLTSTIPARELYPGLQPTSLSCQTSWTSLWLMRSVRNRIGAQAHTLRLLVPSDNNSPAIDFYLLQHTREEAFVNSPGHRLRQTASRVATSRRLWPSASQLQASEIPPQSEPCSYLPLRHRRD